LIALGLQQPLHAGGCRAEAEPRSTLPRP
jgi:hypothetical protein